MCYRVNEIFTLQEIKMDYPHVKDRHTQLLIEWFRNYSPTLQKLCDILSSMEPQLKGK